MWRYPDDTTQAVIRAQEQICSADRECHLHLPETAIVFFMSKAAEYLAETYEAVQLPEPFPRFLNRCPVWEIPALRLCVLNGGSGAPQACDTVETLAALGVRNILAVGMFGAFDPRIELGQILAPEKAFVEEGTSLHYYTSIEYAQPDAEMLHGIVSELKIQSFPIVSTDAVYRQTFYKERLWREKGAVGVDMETSAVFSVSRYLGLRSAALLMASDIHPMHPDDVKWDWKMTQNMRFDLAEKSIPAAKQFSQ